VEDTLVGGCSCGSIRYSIRAVFDVIYCHCSQCRKRTGAPVNCTMAVAGDQFRLTLGAPKMRVTSEHGRAFFCSDCGSPVCWEGFAPSHLLARDGRYYSVPVGTLDNPDRVQPQIHQFWANRLTWFNTADDLPRIADNMLPHPKDRKSGNRSVI
jgi:hypothetical protein